MRDKALGPNLALPQIPVGERETPRSLESLLYRGGAGLPLDQAHAAIHGGGLGAVVIERVELARRIHDFIAGRLAAGGRPSTARNQIDETRRFFAWADNAGHSLTVESVAGAYLNYCEDLLRQCLVLKGIGPRTAYSTALRVSQILTDVLERQKPLIHLTRLKRPKQAKTPQGATAERQNLTDTFAFGRLLQDLCDGLALSVIWGSRNVEIALNTGGVYRPWTGGSRRRSDKRLAPYEVRNAERREEAYNRDRSLAHRGRKALVNTRILAELLMFIGQTSMNVAQSFALKLRKFSYSSSVDGYTVRDYKHRRGGEVLFEIFREYRSHFERYLVWRAALFPESDLLFPVIREGSLESREPRFDVIIAACKAAGVKWTPPIELRGTRVNWVLRRSGSVEATTELAQHTEEMLLNVYARPSVQRAISEVAQFWQVNDPQLSRSRPFQSVAPGECDGKPRPVTDKPPSAPSPDCIRPSGCLWCEHHRDVDSPEYVWSVVSFRHLKSLELAGNAPTTNEDTAAHPALLSIERLTEKLRWFKESNTTRRGWVEEGLARVEEGRYHPDWSALIVQVEATA